MGDRMRIIGLKHDIDTESDIPTKKHKLSYDPKPKYSPLETSYNNNNIRQVIDTINHLRSKNVIQETIKRPTFVLVGNQSSGKSSLLESLVGIGLPTISTRVPLIIKLQRTTEESETKFLLEYPGKRRFFVDENNISREVSMAMVEIVGDNIGISSSALTLTVRKNGVPNITFIDLPGIVPVGVGEQSSDTYDEITAMIMGHIRTEETIILNVLSAIDFLTCESFQLSRHVDPTGKRTLSVITKCDQNPNDVFKNVTKDTLNIGLGYICIRNKVGVESYEEARLQESNLFGTHPLLSKLDKSVVGIQGLANRLAHIQSRVISKSLPNSLENINEMLDAYAGGVFIQVVFSFEEALNKILIIGDDYTQEKPMNCNARVRKMLEELSEELQSTFKFSDNFLIDEVNVLTEVKLTKFEYTSTSETAFKSLLTEKLNSVTHLLVNFVENVCEYLLVDIVRALRDRCAKYPLLVPHTTKAALTVMQKMKENFLKKITERIEREKVLCYTCDPSYDSSYNTLMSNSNEFSKISSNQNTQKKFNIEGYGTIDIRHLFDVPEKTRDAAFDLKMRITSYWDIVRTRMVDQIALHYIYYVQTLLINDFKNELENEVMVHGGGMEVMLTELDVIAEKRDGLQKAIDFFGKAKVIITQMMHDIPVSTF